jgi:hypothetical protein
VEVPGGGIDVATSVRDKAEYGVPPMLPVRRLIDRINERGRLGSTRGLSSRALTHRSFPESDQSSRSPYFARIPSTEASRSRAVLSAVM